MTAPGTKHDAGKPRPGLIPGTALLAMGRVLAFGAAKYSVNGWQHVPDARARYTDALLRHLALWLDGEVTDAESGLSHLSHVATNAAFLIWFESQGGAP